MDKHGLDGSDVDRLGGGPHERLLNVAAELFYSQGLRSTGINEVLRRSGTAKASLYDHFGGKEGLVEEYLEDQQRRTAAALAKIEGLHHDFRDRVAGTFDWLGQLSRDENFRGCAFVLAAAEYPEEASAPMTHATRQKLLVRDTFQRWASTSDYQWDVVLIERLCIIYDGALITEAIRPEADAIEVAKSLAVDLVAVAQVSEDSHEV